MVGLMRHLLLISAAVLSLGALDAGLDKKKEAAERLVVMKSEAARYRFSAGPSEKGETVLQPEPLLRWTNPVAEEEDAGLFLWTRAGRPEAAAQFFVRKDVWMHEFQSLSESPFTVRWNGRAVWTPSQPGLRLRLVPGATTPEKSATQRATRMREIAGSFKASVEFAYAGVSRYELRLLSKPVYRYGSDAGEPLDGTVWAFVQGTNPEVLLVVEARRLPDSSLAWHYGLAPMTSYPAEVFRDGKSVWKVDRQPVPTPDALGVYLFRYDVPVSR